MFTGVYASAALMMQIYMFTGKYQFHVKRISFAGQLMLKLTEVASNFSVHHGNLYKIFPLTGFLVGYLN